VADDHFDLDDSLDRIEIRGWTSERVHEVAQMAISMLEEHSTEASHVTSDNCGSVNSVDQALKSWPQTFLAVEAGMSGR
jgi:hypothetical protein